MLSPCDALTAMDALVSQDGVRVGQLYGIILQQGNLDETLQESPIITHVEHRSPAEKYVVFAKFCRLLYSYF